VIHFGINHRGERFISMSSISIVRKCHDNTSNKVVTFTDPFLRNLQPRSVQFEVRDAKVTGLLVRVSPGRTKTFGLWYRIFGKPRRMTLGRYPALTLAEARIRARVALDLVSQGRDPAAEKQKVRENYSSRLVPVIVEEYVEKYAKPHTRGWKETDRLLRVEFVKPWDKLPVESITKQDISKILNAMVARNAPSTANHAFAAIRGLCNWAVSQGYLEASPCLGMKAPTKIKRRQRRLKDSDLIGVWHAARQIGWPFGSIVQLLILTGQRRGEVAGMRWDELDLSTRIWTIPAERNKANRLHTLPLSDATVGLLASLPKVHQEFVFPARGRQNQVSGFSKWKQELDKLGPSGWRLHDLRHTVSSGMAKLKVPPHVIERVLNHKTGVLGGIAGVYNEFEYFPEMQEAVAKWSHFLNTQISDSPSP
jgi:integrase